MTKCSCFRLHRHCSCDILPHKHPHKSTRRLRPMLMISRDERRESPVRLDHHALIWHRTKKHPRHLQLHLLTLLFLARPHRQRRAATNSPDTYHWREEIASSALKALWNAFNTSFHLQRCPRHAIAAAEQQLRSLVGYVPTTSPPCTRGRHLHNAKCTACCARHATTTPTRCL